MRRRARRGEWKGKRSFSLFFLLEAQPIREFYRRIYNSSFSCTNRYFCIKYELNVYKKLKNLIHAGNLSVIKILLDSGAAVRNFNFF